MTINMAAYCDLIAHLIKKHFNSQDDGIKITKINYDLHPTKGYMLSTKKVIEAEDFNGKKYVITVEEADES